MSTRNKAFDHSGSTFDSFLEEEGILEETEAVAMKRVLAWQLERAMKEQHKTKQTMARELRTSRSQLDRLLDPYNVSVSLQTMTRAAKVLGKHLVIRIADSRRPGNRAYVKRERVGRAVSPVAGDLERARYSRDGVQVPGGSVSQSAGPSRKFARSSKED